MKAALESVVGKFAELSALGPRTLGAGTRYGVACGLVVLATLVRLAFAPQEAGLPYVTYFPAATLAAIVGGVGPAVLATLAGALVAVFLFMPPFNGFRLDADVIASALVFCVDEAIVCSAIEAMRRFHSRHADAMAELRKAHEAERLARLAAEAANIAKSRFLAAASHDLRQPYQAMRLFMAVLQNPDLPRDKATQALDKMDAALTAGEELLKSLLDLSTLEAGVVTPKVQDVDCQELMLTLEAAHGSVARAKGLRFQALGAHVTLRTDPVLLRRILDNLTANAIRYTEKGRVMVACRRHGQTVVFEVWDTGIGIAPQHREAVFEEFFQVGNLERDRTKGAGLGLAVVRRTAALIGATLDLTSRPNRGTRFRVTLPVAQ